MLMMQTNDSRLIKAAKRTIRAEATLVIVILIITSWSVYALYKIATGDGTTHTILGINLSRALTIGGAGSSENEPAVSKKSGNEDFDTKKNININLEAATLPSVIYSHVKPQQQQQQQQPLEIRPNEGAIEKYRNQILQGILARRRELFGLALDQQEQQTTENHHQVLKDLYRKKLNDLITPPATTTTTTTTTLEKDGLNHSMNLNNLIELQRSQQQQANLWPINHYNRSGRQVSGNKLAAELPSLMQINPKKNPQEPAPKVKELRINNSIEESNDSSKLQAELDENLLPLTDDEFNGDKQVAESNNNPEEVINTWQSSKQNDDNNNNSDHESEQDNNNSVDNDNENTSLENGEFNSNQSPNEEQAITNDQESTSANDDDNKQTDDSNNSSQEQANKSSSSSSSYDNVNNNDDYQSPSEDNNSTEEKTLPNEDSLKETGHIIDEEVDRMTQPSSSDVVSQQDKPFDYKNTVQFDDSLSTSNVLSSSASTGKGEDSVKKLMLAEKKEIPPGNQIARFIDPQVRDEKSSKKKKKKQKELDLQVDHNSLLSVPHMTDKLVGREKELPTTVAAKKLQHEINKTPQSNQVSEDEEHLFSKKAKVSKKPSKEHGPLDKFSLNITSSTSDTKSIPEPGRPKIKRKTNRDSVVASSNAIEDKRTKRSATTENLLTSPYEPLENFLDNLNFDNLLGQSSSREVKIENYGPGRSDYSTASGSNEAPYENHNNNNQTQGLRRRFDDNEEDYDDNTDQNDPSSGNDDANHSTGNDVEARNNNDNSNDQQQQVRNMFYEVNNGGGDGNNNAKRRSPPQTQYHYLASNDSDLQNLLAEKRLLEYLSKSQLPPPTQLNETITNFNSSLYNPKGGSSSSSSSSDKVPKPILAGGNNDHQTAGSLYTVDHGLLLYPSADEEHHSNSKSMAKKKKKHKKMKKKKKMTKAMKKGGHKKKKHKKMEKKFLKEKKFKGAKKGKKSSKGKGGQGGKKGKKKYKDKGFKKKGFKNVYHKEEFGQKKSYFDEYRDKDFKKKWKKYDDKYNYAQMKKWQAKDVKGAKKMKDHSEKFKKYDKSKWKKKYHKDYKEHSAKESMKKKKNYDGF